MKKTETKYLVKVNQIFPIMQEHFGNSMNLARIKPHGRVNQRVQHYEIFLKRPQLASGN